MQKIVTLGVMLLGIVSCNVPTLEKPITMYEINISYRDVGVGLTNLNIKDSHKKVGKWVNKNELVFIDLSEAPNLLRCFSQKKWDEVIVPKLQEGARAYRDFTD